MLSTKDADMIISCLTSFTLIFLFSNANKKSDKLRKNEIFKEGEDKFSTEIDCVKILEDLRQMKFVLNVLLTEEQM
jgi:hypothetical protein